MMKLKPENLRDFKETLIVFGVMTAVFLPVRLLFVAYVSDDWFGSFVMIAGISVLFVVLVEKKKLGRFGEMFHRQMLKLQKGKRAKIVYGKLIFVILIESVIISGINLGDTVYSEMKTQVVEEHPELADKEQMLEMQDDLKPEEWLLGILLVFVGFVVAFPQMAVLMSLINDAFDGWILHVYTVGFVESLEVFAMLLFYRFRGRI